LVFFVNGKGPFAVVHGPEALSACAVAITIADDDAYFHDFVF